jgi:uncharacterized protein (DUF1501 family)
MQTPTTASSTNSKRQFIKGSAACLAGIGSSGASGILVSHSRAAESISTNAKLVVIMLRGAVDGLSVVAPYADANYYAARPTIAIAKPGDTDGLLRLDNMFGLHPALAMLMPYWERSQLGFIHASGSHDSTRSHFDAQDYMESGTPGKKSTPDGWLNRLALALSQENIDASRRLQAVNLGPVMPRIFAGSSPVASLAQGNAAVAKGVLDREPVADAFTKLYSGDDKLSQTVREATQTRKEIMNSLASDDPKADQGALSLRGLSQDTARLGQLMQRDARVRLAFVPVGGWDTHVNQGNGKGQLANRLTLLGDGIHALIQNMGDRFGETTIIVMSEFGRTLRQNGNQGTDHGHGNVMWTVGGKHNGGQVQGQWPGLEGSALNEGRDLAITTDFRDPITNLLEQKFRLNDRQLSTVFPDMKQRNRSV